MGFGKMSSSDIGRGFEGSKHQNSSSRNRFGDAERHKKDR